MSKYHVTYYYLATGMERVADEVDYGMVEAESEQEALEYIAQYRDPKAYAVLKGDENDSYRLWGLSAELVEPTEDQKFLMWIRDRLEYVHGENPNVDFMLKLKEMGEV